MEEIKCKGTPAQVARRVLAVLAEDPDLHPVVYPDVDRPTSMADVTMKMRNWSTLDLPEDTPVIVIEVIGRYSPDRQGFKGGMFQAEKLTDYTLLTASARIVQYTKTDRDKPAQRDLVEDFSSMAPLWEKVQVELTKHGLVIEKAAPRRSGPTVKTQERAKVFKTLKDKHPTWSYEKVAMEACDILGENVTGATVTNAYNAMCEYFGPEDWTWERADRVR